MQFETSFLVVSLFFNVSYIPELQRKPLISIKDYGLQNVGFSSKAFYFESSILTVDLKNF